MTIDSMHTMDDSCINDDSYSQNFASVKLRFSLSTTLLVYGIYLLPFCFGIFGNISVCLIFFQQKKLRSITNTFLMNLCINDLIVLCVSIPMTLSAALLEHWIFGAFLCKLLNFAPTVIALVSTFTVATISVERWFFIVNKKKFDRRCTIITLILLWFVSILIALPEFLSRRIQEFAPPSIPFPMMEMKLLLHTRNDLNDTGFPLMNMIKPLCHMKKIYFCVLNPGIHMRIFSYIVITVQYLVPFIFVSVSCYSISRFLKGRMKHMRTYQVCRSAGNNDNSLPKQRKKPKLQHQSSDVDDITEHKFTDYEEISVTVVKDENKNNHALTRLRSIFKNRKQHPNSLDLEPLNSPSPSDINPAIMPNVRVQSHSERRFHRSKKLLICVAALFTISWLPLTVVQIYLEHNEEITRDEPNFVYAYLLIPCYLISSLSAWMNPIIYNYINRSFRREFYALYPCCCKFSSSLATSSFTSTRRAAPTVTEEKLHRRTFKDIEEKSDATKACSANKSGVHIIAFADGETKIASIDQINKHI
ncbi:unnamed protein product [Rotaria magnacalcarata]|uniref:G-protein coupled receptors family 1 profile domain-containing protein n=2 Tax=Rotaria magnacalcarata TaxID=392030 RepID=A0A814R385_9BILA|nr:unnamed protein product [Rotaria magnacalcarata]CAF2166286.1 unnamed protein product [Rotaria magnacalcarata]CAF3764015.1 unnamed protein product [Rotaria magnacalcarata]CAF3795210.1 unnamed protein product [Rotaria magnacalcarata]CAF3818184.1 unnamed protein product [Rotaria magnacalcarata]